MYKIVSNFNLWDSAYYRAKIFEAHRNNAYCDA